MWKFLLIECDQQLLKREKEPKVFKKRNKKMKNSLNFDGADTDLPSPPPPLPLVTKLYW